MTAQPPTSQPPTQEGMHRRLAQGFLAKSLAVIIQFGQQFLLVPVFLHFWGPERYSDWLVLLSTVTFLSLLDLGLQTTYSNELLMTWSRGERRAFNRVLHHGLAIYLILVLVAVSVLMVGAYAMPWPDLLNLKAATPVTATMVIGVLGLYVLANIPIAMVANIYRARGEFALGSAVGSASLVTYLCATMVTLWLDGGMVMLAAAHLVVVAATWGAIVTHLKRRYIDLHFGLRRPSRNEIRKAMTTSPAYAVIPAAMALNVHGTVLMIAGLGAGAVEVVVFTTIRTLTGVARQAAAQLGQAAGAEMSRHSLHRAISHRWRVSMLSWGGSAAP